jgi:glycosyltransferase involved in cell wall biosynthesis
MRIAVVNWSARREGGAEAYLDLAIPGLAARGHSVALLTEVGGHAAPPGTAADAEIPRWCVQESGGATVAAELRRWRPDVLYVHSIHDVALHRGLLANAPGVYYAHAYAGTCISGAKTWKTPVPTPCSRTFGPGCLLHYYPHRCGGLSPLTMLRDYRSQSELQAILRDFAGLVTNSEHMRREYLAHGFGATDAGGRRQLLQTLWLPVQAPETTGSVISGLPGPDDPLNLLFLGRAEMLKGGMVVLDALGPAARALGRRLRLVMAGDGPERERWSARAKRLMETDPRVEVELPGWVDGSVRAGLLAEAHLLVVPSLWPEPFGLVGPEAGTSGVPAVAFAVGGIPDWLEDGVNGRLAPGAPPTASGLSEAIVRALADPADYARLREGARRAADRFALSRHLDGLEQILRAVVERGPPAPGDVPAPAGSGQAG